MAKKIVLDQATRDQLLGLVPMSAEATYDFVPSVYLSIAEELQPNFTIVQLSMSDVATVKTLAVQEVLDAQKKTKPNASKLVARALKKHSVYCEIADRCIKGWSNLYTIVRNDEGEDEMIEVEYDEGISIETVFAGSERVVLAIFNEILKISGLGVM